MSEISTLESTQELVAHQLIGQMREENMRLSAAVNETGRYPDWWADGQDLTSTRDIESDFKLGNGSPEDVAAYYVLTAERAKIRKELTGFDSSADQLFYDFSLGADVMAKGLAATGEDGDILRKDVLEGIANPDMDAKTELLSTVQSYYGAKRATDLLAVRGEGFDQQVRTALRTAPGIKALAYEDNKMNYEDTWKQTIEKGREWFADALATSEGIDITAAREYTFSAGVNNRGEQLAKVLNAFDHFGPERIRKISEATNIYGLEAYSIGQLERMEEFATNPQALSERLKNHDVTVVLTNRSGDYNGVMTDNSQMVEDGETSGRCLFFEMNTMDDIYRTFVKLQRAGIQPSTLWLAAHSGEGQFVVSDERPVGSKHASIAAVAAREVVAAVNESEEAREKNYFGFSLHGMKGFS
ncbi:MAG TPA: hypothetical protein PK865_00425, partial [Candidatus Saccharibacteria bacterium]|nr:hypothetical protein [Candidatus Saccharibacteria bacterium]